MQPSPLLHEFHDASVQPHPAETPLPDPTAVLRAYGGGAGFPSDRWKMDLQAQLVGAVVFVLAGMCLLATLVLLLGRWMPVWLVTLGLTLALTALGLALFSSVSRSVSGRTIQAHSAPLPAEDVSTIDEIDPTEVESVRMPEPAAATLDPHRLTPHPILATHGTEPNDADSNDDGDDLKTRPLGNLPPPTLGRKRLRAEMPSSASFNGHS